MSGRKVYAIDVDNTLTEHYDYTDYLDHSPKHYIEVFRDLKPRAKMVEYVRKLYSNPNNVVYIYTARDDIYEEVTIEWLKKHNIPCHHVTMKKLHYDVFIDDRTMRPEEVE